MIKAGDWAVIAAGRWSSYEMGETYEVSQVDRVTAKTVFTSGRAHYRRSHNIGLVTACANDAAARLLCSRLQSAKAEMDRRVSEAGKAYKKTAETLLAQASLASPDPRDDGEK